MLRFFQNNHPLMFLLYFLIGGLIAFAIPENIITEINIHNKTFLFKQILNLIQGQYFVIIYKIIIAFLLVLNAYAFNRLVISAKLFKSNNAYHGFIYLILIGLAVVKIDSFIILNVSLLIIFILHITFKTIRKTIAIFDFFNVGLLFSIAFLLWEQTIYFLPFIFITLLILRMQKWREWLAILIGIFIPIFIFTSFYFFISSNFDIIFDHYILFFRSKIPINFSIIQFITEGIILLFSVISLFKILSRFNSLESNRQDYYKIFLFLFLNASVLFIISPSSFYNFYIIAMIALNIPLSTFFISRKSKILSEITFDIFLIMSILLITSFSF